MRSQVKDIFVAQQYAFQPRSPSPVIVDCGGNVGLSAIWFKRTYPGCQLTVFEADPDLAAMLRRNLASAKCGEVTVRDQAVWIENEPVGFLKTGDDKGKIDRHGTATVAAVDLVGALPERVDLLKLDIEGAEYAVLDRLCRSGAIKRVDCLICEFHVWRERTGELFQVLQQLEASGLELAMTADIVPSIGNAEEEAPFERIGRRQMLVEVYGWR